MKTTIKAGRSLLLLGIAHFFCLAALAQAQFKVGDKVEASYAGDWIRAVIVGGYEHNGTEGTYEVQFEGYKYPSRIASKWVRQLFRSDIHQKFQPGDRVEFRRWNNDLFDGEIIGIDKDKYEIRYTRDGFDTKEWISELAVRASTKAPAAKGNAAVSKTPAGTAWAGQKFKVGDRVVYGSSGLFVAKATGSVVSVDAEKRLYTVRDEKDPSSKYSYPCYCVIAPNEKFSNDFFIGKWEVFVSGATYTTVEQGKVYLNVSGGMKLPPLEIKANGTYTWVSDKKVINGVWKPRQDVPGITLLNGLDGLDWTVYENTEAMAASKSTRDEIRFHHLPSSTGYYMAYRIGGNKSCVLAGRTFK